MAIFSQSRIAATFATSLLTAASVHAEGLDVQISGFGTVAVTYADTADAQFRSSWQQGRGSRQKVDLGVDTRLGVQLDVGWDDIFSATGQLLAQRLGTNNKLSVEWLYGQAQLNAEVVFRVGRLVLPAFMLSDVRNVGYAQHWVHTPYEVYLTFPPVNGAQLLYRDTWQGIKFAVQPTVGQAQATMYYQRGPSGQGLVSAQTHFHQLYAINLTAEKGSWSARVGHTYAVSTIEWGTIPDEPLTYGFTSVGAQYDNGRLLAIAEVMLGRTDSRRYDIDGQYFTGGYRFGAWMPYLTYARLNNRGTAISVLPTARTVAAGLRWDALRDVALKAQVERARYAGQQFIAVAPGTDARRSAPVFTLAVDFIF